MSKEEKKIILQKGKEKSLLRLHPWLFSGAIKEKSNNIIEGDAVCIYSNEGLFLAKGFWQNDSIAVKVLSFDDQTIDDNFWYGRIKTAYEYREKSKVANAISYSIYRLVNGEGDNLPSLIVDCYGDLVVMQFHSVFMYLHREAICKAIKSVLGKECTAIFNKSSSTLPKKGGIFCRDEFLSGEICDELYAYENDIKYLIDYKCGQKTGFFIDQRENRHLLSQMAYGKRVLNAFAYTGGFSLSAMKGCAKCVTSVDISKRAIEICERNFVANESEDRNIEQNCTHTEVVADVMNYMNEVKKGEYDVIVLDPPAFAKHQKDLQSALKAYREINRKAIEKIDSCGFLFTFSCSQAVSREDFSTMLFSAAALAKRNVRTVKRLQAAYDHPQSIFHPEGEYLKGLLLYVE